MNGDLNDRLAAAREPDTDTGLAAMEAAVLVALAKSSVGDDQEGRAGLVLQGLGEDDFTREDRRVVFRAIKALSANGDGVNAVTLADWTKTNGAALQEAEIAAVFDAGDGPDLKALETYVRRLGDRGRLQAARRATAAVTDALDNPRADIDAIAAKVQNIAFGMTTDRRLVGDQLTEADILTAFLKELEDRNDGRDLLGLDTGFGELNRVTGGLGQALVIIGGPPSCGKTTFLKQLADQVAEKNKVPVLFFTYEQPAADLRIKTLARLSGRDSRVIARGAWAAQPKVTAREVSEEWERANKRFGTAICQYQAFGQHIRIIEAGRETTVDRIRLQARAAKAKAGAARVLVVVDYVQLVPAADPLTGRAFPSVREKTDFVCSELRRLARDLDSPVVAISSLSRQGYSAEKMDAFKESGGIEYGADVAILLKTTDERTGVRQGVERGWSDPTTCRTVEARIVKNRGGDVGAIQMDLFAALAMFVERGRFTPEAYTKGLSGTGGSE